MPYSAAQRARWAYLRLQQLRQCDQKLRQLELDHAPVLSQLKGLQEEKAKANAPMRPDELRKSLVSLCAQSLGKALAPKAVRFVGDLPHTRNGKMMRRVARARFLKHESLGDLSALENPASLAAIDAAH